MLALWKRLKEEGLHTAVDTSGILDPLGVKDIYEACDLVLLDLKCADSTTHKKLTGWENTMPLQTLDYLTKINKPFWARHVLVPDWTTKPELLESLAQMVKNRPSMVRFEILPFHQMGLYKWQEMRLEYQLKDTEQPSREEIEGAVAIFKKNGVEAHV